MLGPRGPGSSWTTTLRRGHHHNQPRQPRTPDRRSTHVQLRPRLQSHTCRHPPNPHVVSRKAGGKGKGEDLSVWDGSKFLKTRNGTCICRGYQDGSCQRMNSWNLCAYDGSSAHQCELCLMVGHGSGDKTKCPKQGKGKGAGGRGRGGAGRGRGRGRGQ